MKPKKPKHNSQTLKHRHRKERDTQSKKLTPSGSDGRNGYSKVNTHYTRGTRKYLRQSRALHDSLHYTSVASGTSFFPKEKTSSWLASHLITRRMLRSILTLFWHSIEKRRIDNSSVKREKTGGDSRGQDSDVKRSGGVERIVWHHNNVCHCAFSLALSSSPSLRLIMAGGGWETTALRRGKILHPITSSLFLFFLYQSGGDF